MDLIRRLKKEKAESGAPFPHSSQTQPVDSTRLLSLLTAQQFSFTPIALASHRCSSGPSDIFYVPDFISAEDEEQLVRSLDMGDPWIQLKTRRLKCYGDDISGSSWLEALLDGVVSSGIWEDATTRPNHVLINDYSPGQGIMHHTDGPLYRDHVVILSLGSSATMSFRPNLKPSEIGIKSQLDVARVHLQPRSALVFRGDAYRDYLHGILDVTHDEVCDDDGITINLGCLPSSLRGSVARGRRISLTIRRKL